MSINVAYGALSISVAKAGNSRILINADSSRPSRPYVYGTVYYDIYRVEI